MASTKSYAQDIRLFHIGDMLKEKCNALWETIFSEKKQIIKKQTKYSVVFDFLPQLVIAIATIDISFGILKGQGTIGDYSLYTALMSQAWSALTLTINHSMDIYENKLKIDNVKSLDAILNHISYTGKVNLDNIISIEFKGVTFRYPETSRKVLQNISFMIHSGEKIALVGTNGSGKTTLFKLMLRFYEVDEGEILINGINIIQYNVESLHKCFSCYFQNAVNYGFTFMENVSISDYERLDDTEMILHAIRDSGAESILQKSPLGVNTYLTREFDQNGVELSGGEHQKIALARLCRQ